jgi:hypothetical protein
VTRIPWPAVNHRHALMVGLLGGVGWWLALALLAPVVDHHRAPGLVVTTPGVSIEHVLGGLD